MSSPPMSQQHHPPPPSQTPRQHHHRSSSEESTTSTSAAGRSPPDARPTSTTFPFSFIQSSQSKQTSTSIIPSTAEGKAIPVDDSTVENRTTALRELNSHYPSRHRYEKSTGAQSSTYSEPVIVRSYYSPVAARPAASSRGGGSSSGVGVVVHGPSGAKSQAGSSASRESRGLPFVTTVASARNGMMNRMPRLQQNIKLPAAADDTQAKLPPIEAFTFKSFIANMEAQSGPASDINADLDRIAEICARSRYSLSNQYEVHYAPHGSGSSFIGGSSHAHDAHGPTLQVVSSDDEHSMKRQRRRRNGARRSSRAMGTLETIMSSSRSSDEERSKKKSAAELADQVRGRATGRSSDESSSAGSSPIDNHNPADELPKPTTPSKSKASLALIDGQALAPVPSNSNTTPHSSATGLVSELALPQASTSQLELRTVPEPPSKQQTNVYTTPKRAATAENLATPVAKGSISPTGRKNHGSGLFSAIGGWLPWLSSSSDGSHRSAGRAEGSLRQLLRTPTANDLKGKGVAVEA